MRVESPFSHRARGSGSLHSWRRPWRGARTLAKFAAADNAPTGQAPIGSRPVAALRGRRYARATTIRRGAPMPRKTLAAAALAVACAGTAHAAPPTVEMTWMSIANWYFKIGDKRIVMDGYI